MWDFVVQRLSSVRSDQRVRTRNDDVSNGHVGSTDYCKQHLVEGVPCLITSSTHSPCERAPSQLGVTLFVLGNGIDRARDDSVA